MRLATTVALLFCLAMPLRAQSGQSGSDVEPASMFAHQEDQRFWLSGSVNIILQAHPAFEAAYSGEHSLRPIAEKAVSRLLTLFTGFKATQRTELLLDVESAGGRGISDALGLAGFTNLDVVRNPTLGASPYLARLMVHHTIPLSREERATEPSALSLARRVPARRIEVRVGKFGTVDFFDANAVGSDNHLQFMNWTVDNNGAYDYAADTRGYTWGAVVEYRDDAWAVRFGELLMPKVANGIEFDWNVSRSRAENVEVEWRSRRWNATILRGLSYFNHANMGDYRVAIQRFEAGLDAMPVIENSRRQGRLKYGVGVNGEQQITPSLRAFARLGWNEPHFESFAYTEANSAMAVGADQTGRPWHRSLDKIGGAVATNGISDDHQRYLALGGAGFLLGDGALNYRRENIFEVYYTAHVWRGAFASTDLQRIVHPGYNRDRGPAIVGSVRLHIDL